MGRINETDRLPMLAAHLAHWADANALPGGPLLLDLPTDPSSTLSRAQLQTQATAYETIVNLIMDLEDITLPTLRAERDSLFGTSANDTGTPWFWLILYRDNVRQKLGRRHPLSRTVPNLGSIIPGEYLHLIQRFLDHWTRVNAALPVPFLLGTYALADLTTRHGELDAKLKEITDKESDLDLKRVEREDLFGDVVEDERRDDSLITHLELYHATIPVKYPGQAIVATLPRIFPVPSAPLPKFKFNWRDLGGGQLKTWLADPGLVHALTLHLQEGIVQQNKPFTPVNSGHVTAQTWTGITMVGELDALELLDSHGATVARGQRDGELGEAI